MASLRDIRSKIKLALSEAEGYIKNTVGRGPAMAGNLLRRTREACPARASAQQITFIFLMSLISAVASSAEKWIYQPGWNKIEFVSPETVKILPAEIVKALKNEGCRLPQPVDSRLKATNVLQGEFATPGQKDWVILCNEGGHTRTRFFWGGAKQCESTIQMMSKPFVNRTGANVEYYGSLKKFSKDELFAIFTDAAYEASQGRRNEFTHDGVSGPGFMRYCDGMNWLDLGH